MLPFFLDWILRTVCKFRKIHMYIYDIIIDLLLRQCCFVWSQIVGPHSSGNFNDWPLKLYIYIYIKKGLFWVHVLLKTSNLTGRFHVVVVQQRLRNVQKSVMHLQSCCFAYLNPLIFCRSRWLRRRNCLSSSFIQAGVIIMCFKKEQRTKNEATKNHN